MAIEIKQYRKKWAIFAGKSKLATGFFTPDDAKAELSDNFSLYEYWAGSAGVSIENTEAVVINV